MGRQLGGGVWILKTSTKYLECLLGVKSLLVGGWTNPSQKYARQIGSFPQFSGWKFQKYFKPPPRLPSTPVTFLGSKIIMWAILIQLETPAFDRLSSDVMDELVLA